MSSSVKVMAPGTGVAYGSRVGSALSASAIRDVEATEVLAAVEDWLGVRGIGSTRRTPEAGDDGSLRVFEAQRGWTTLLWPDFFLPRDVAACTALSRDLHTVVSATSSTPHEGWSHTLVGCGTVLDRFHSYPAGLAWDDGDDMLALAEQWRGDPALVARVFGVDEGRVRRHFCQACPGTRDHPGLDRWGFVALWAALGITYPGAGSVPCAWLDLDPSWQRLTA